MILQRILGTTLLLVILVFIPTNVRSKRSDLDFLKADILKYVLEKEENKEEAETAIDILQFILGTRTGTTAEEWESAQEIVEQEPDAPPLPTNQDELNDVIGLYQDTFEDYNEIDDAYVDYQDVFEDYGSFQDSFDDVNVISNTFEYADTFGDYNINQDNNEKGEFEVEESIDVISDNYVYSDVFDEIQNQDSNYQDDFEEYNEIQDSLDDYNDIIEILEDDFEYDIQQDLEDTGQEIATADVCETTDADSETESLTVIDSKTFIMTEEEDDSSNATIVLQEVAEHKEKVNLVCNFTTSDTSLISSSDCDPEIYLVSGHSTCHVSSLPDTVSARKLAEIHVAGYGEVLVDVTWSEVANTCILIVRKTSCSTSDTEEDLTTTLATPRQQICQSTLRAVSGSRFRSFTSINLSGFTVLLSGSAPRTINIVSSPSAGTVTFAGLEITNFNRYGTWPLLQLPGLTGATAVTIAISMIAGYYGFALLTASSANNRRLSSFRKRKGFLQPTPPYHREKRYKRRSKSQRPSARSSNSEEEILMSIVDKTLKDINEEWSRLYKVGSYS